MQCIGKKMMWARTSDGEILSLVEGEESAVPLYCRICGQKLGIKKTKFGRFFFYHQRSGKKETHDFTVHQKIQKEIAYLLQQEGAEEVFQEYVLVDGVRADVVAQRNAHFSVFEIQRTTIREEEIIKRNHVYSSYNKHLYWILEIKINAFLHEKVVFVNLRKWQHRIITLSPHVLFLYSSSYYQIVSILKVGHQKYAMYVERKSMLLSDSDMNGKTVANIRTVITKKAWYFYLKKWQTKFAAERNGDSLWEKLYQHRMCLDVVPQKIYCVVGNFIRFSPVIYWMQTYLYLCFKYENTSFEGLYVSLLYGNLLIDKRKHRIISVLKCYKNFLVKEGLV